MLRENQVAPEEMKPRNRTNDGDGDGRVRPRIQRGAINPENG